MQEQAGETLAVPAEPGDEVGSVNPHYLGHMAASADRHELRASADIVSGSGVKLLAKGARIEPGMRERLLQHKLARPLEDCLSMADGITPQRLAEQAESLLARHGLALALDAPDAEENLPQALGRLGLSPALQSLLTVYADQQGDRLDHACGVALLALALARRLLPGQTGLQRRLALAGLVHDVGELYIDPALLDRSRVLEPQQWRQIASHPVIGYRVLSTMEGAGPVVAEAVLCHHERLDGFGYPRGLADEQFGLPAQILAAAEWLTGLVEAGVGPLMRASVAAKLIPGEFSPALLELVYAALRGSSEMALWLESQQQQAAAELGTQVEDIAQMLERFRGQQDWMEHRLGEAGPELRAVLEQGQRRLQRIQASFSSAGLDALGPRELLADLAQQGDARLRRELPALIGEFGWRLRELERACLLRASLLGSEGLGVVRELVGRLRGA
ncbi:HD domain-containing protein [Roseateles sp. DAIF2]|uniref:HD-GYP domain-containing protein n=1 Tax=Roseateles sp. DAIF2 TaxID=2714952 RepID=UPI0018A2F07D|nr:HD domain-containing phosphohydrolase [Roseateles sp. DAIF2]QPF75675.1 HD domain-containing protein [Roseateles sp. DAIF2]